LNTNKIRKLAEQAKELGARFVQGGKQKLGGLFTAKQMQEMVKETVGPHRERGYGPVKTLKLFLDQVLGSDHSCRSAVAHGASCRAGRTGKVASLNTGPYCKARKRLPLALIERVSAATVQQMSQHQDKSWLWRGRPVKLVDGTTVSMPDTADNHAQFSGKKQKQGMEFPRGRLVGVISLSCAAVLDWALGPYEGKGTGECALLRQLIRGIVCGDVVITDRAYAGYFMIAGLLAQGADIVMRQHQTRKTDWRRGRRLGKRDHVVQWVRPQRPKWMDEADYAAMPERLEMREVQVGQWTLISSLCDAKEVSKADLNALYLCRWHVELDLRSIKQGMQMDVLRCKTADMVRKEVAVHLLAYNLVRAVMAQAAVIGRVLPRRLSFQSTLQVLNEFKHTLIACASGRLIELHEQLLYRIQQLRLPYRPDRVEPRAVKRRPKPHRLLNQPRDVARAELRNQQDHIFKMILEA
jgi:hypothetical protein